MRIRKQFAADSAHIGEIVAFVSERLERSGMKKRDRIMAELTVEEAAGSLIAHGGAEEITVALRGRGNLTVELSQKGEEYSPADEIASASISAE